MTEHFPDRHLHLIFLVDPRDQLDRLQRRAAQCKKRISPARPADPQQLLPDPGQPFLQPALRRFVYPRLPTALRLRQRLAVHLPVHVQRQLFQPDKIPRHQRSAQPPRQLPDKRLRTALPAHIVTDQLLIARPVLLYHQLHLPDIFQRQQRHPDFIQLDAYPVQLHLLIAPAHHLHIPVRPVAAQVACTAHYVRLWRQRILHEQLPVQRPVQIPLAHIRTLDIDISQLSYLTDMIPVHYGQQCIADALSYREQRPRLPVPFLYPVTALQDRRLRQSV